MEHYQYLIIGGGMTADSAVRGIRQLDASERIGIISNEMDPPYDRPPLTKGLWFGKPLDSIWRKTEKERVSLHLGCQIISIDPQQHIVYDQKGEAYGYQKLLLAVGGTPRTLNCPDEGVIYFRNLQHYRQLRSLYDKGNHFVVIGSGFIGTEIAAALAMNGKKVTMVFKEPCIGSTKYPRGFSDFLNAFFIEKGILLIPEETISSVTREKDQSIIKTSSGKIIHADGVIAGLGILPNIDLGGLIGIKIEDGFVVDSYLQTSHQDIYAAGDVANFYSPHLDKRLRIEHEDGANTMGYAAGRNMAGAHQPYTHLPFFYSDIFELGYEAIGEIGKDMEIIEDWSNQYREGALYYLRDGRLRGAMFWGIWNQIDMARELIASKEQMNADALMDKFKFPH